MLRTHDRFHENEKSPRRVLPPRAYEVKPVLVYQLPRALATANARTFLIICDLASIENDVRSR